MSAATSIKEHAQACVASVGYNKENAYVYQQSIISINNVENSYVNKECKTMVGIQHILDGYILRVCP